MDGVRDKILRLVDEKGFDLKNLSECIGRNGTYLHHFIHRQSPRVLREGDRYKLAAALGVDEDALLTDEQLAEREGHRRDLVYNANIIEIPSYNFEAFSGGENQPSVEGMLFYSPFRLGWIEEISSSPPEKLIVFCVDSDAMSPTLMKNDAALVDTACGRVAGDGLYLLKYGGGAAIKRISADPGGASCKVTNDNPIYSSAEKIKISELNIVGRVVWVGRRV